MSEIFWITILVVWYAALTPLTHFSLPIVNFVWNVFKHTLVIPTLLVLRITLFGLVYLPLTPVLSVAKVKYDTEVAVEVSLFRLFVDLKPHIQFFLLNLLHYVMISLFVGTFVGFVAGFNISIVARIVALPEGKARSSRKTQTTPYVNAIEQRVAKVERKEAAETKPHEPDSEPLPSVSNIPVIKKEEVPAILLKQLPSSSTDAEVYEDDDGYSYMSYDLPETSPFQYLSHVDSVHTILEEEESNLEEESLEDSKVSTPDPAGTLNPTTAGTTFTADAGEELVQLETTSDEEDQGKK